MPTTRTVSSGVVSSGLVLHGGDVLNVLSGGRVVSTVVNSGAQVTLSGLDDSAIINAGGIETVSGGGAATSARVNGGLLQISKFGHAFETTVLAGGLEIVGSQGSATSSFISSGGTESILRGGTERSATILNGGTLNVSGLCQVTQVSSGGTLFVNSFGSAQITTVLDGGVVSVAVEGHNFGVVSSGGEVIVRGTDLSRVLSGGLVLVEQSGFEGDDIIEHGGELQVLSGGFIEVGDVEGGVMVLSSGSLAGGVDVNSHGKAVFQGGAQIAGEIAFLPNSGGVIDLVDPEAVDLSPALFTGFRGFHNKIDLGGFAFSAGETFAWTQGLGKGNLTVTDGAKSVKLRLKGHFVENGFRLATDKHGGTFVTYTPNAPTAAAERFIGAAAALTDGRSQGAAAHRAHDAPASAVSAFSVASRGR